MMNIYLLGIPAKQDVWVRQPPSFAIRNHKLLRPRIDAYQDFLPRTTVSGITMVGIRTAESVQRLQNIASMTKAGNKNDCEKSRFFRSMTGQIMIVWLFLSEKPCRYPGDISISLAVWIKQETDEEVISVSFLLIRQKPS